MIKCHACDVTFMNNDGGQLTIHLSSVHGLTYADWVVVTKLSGVEPRCMCGLCEERPVLLRDKFQRYAAFHNRHDVKQRLWITKHGTPKCMQCKNDVAFFRGVPRTHCSQRCAMIGKGFANSNIQEKIVNTIKERYGVDNISQLCEIRQKISASNIGKHNTPKTNEAKKLISVASRVRWSDPEYKARTSAAIKLAVNTPKERSRRSRKMKDQMSDETFQNVVWSHHKNRLTKMHQRMRSALKLDDKGFTFEQRIGRRWVDELNVEKKIIVEFFGDHPHANPKKYKPDDVIRLRGQSYTASEKWKYDKERRKELEAKGYRVVNVWESDDVNEVNDMIQEILTSCLKSHPLK